jgi:ferric-dicitrate binding protein FerR (iron transport regulator)
MSNHSAIGRPATRASEPGERSSTIGILRRALRFAYAPFCGVFAIGFAYLNYIVLGPALVRGWIAHAWDSATEAGMLDAVSGHRHARRVAFADGSSVVLSLMSWVRYPRAFTGPARTVYLEGQGEFVVRTGDRSFVVQTKPVSIETDTAEFRVWGTSLDPVCAIELVSGRIRVSLGARQRSVELEAPRTWVRGQRCAPVALGHVNSRAWFDTSTVRK